MSDLLSFPNSGIQNADGSLNTAGHSLIARMAERISLKPAGSAEEFLVGGRALVRAEAVLGTMEALRSSGAGDWQPDLGQRFDFIRTLEGPTTVLFPANVPEDLLPFFSVRFIQNSAGGAALDFGSGFRGQAPSILLNAGDETLIGFKVWDRSPDQFTAWSVKGVQAGT